MTIHDLLDTTSPPLLAVYAAAVAAWLTWTAAALDRIARDRAERRAP